MTRYRPPASCSMKCSHPYPVCPMCGSESTPYEDDEMLVICACCSGKGGHPVHYHGGPDGGLTAIQKWLYEFMIESFLAEQRPPTLRDIARFAGYTGMNAVNGHMNALARKGYIARGRGGRSRGIKFLKTPDGVRIKDIRLIAEGEDAC